MKNNTKLIMETWRRFLNENDPVDEPEVLDAPGYHDAYADDMPEDEMDSEVYGVDEEGYDETGRDFQDRYGQYSDPEDPEPTGEPVEDEDLSGFDVIRNEPEEGFFDDDYNPDGYDPDAWER